MLKATGKFLTVALIALGAGTAAAAAHEDYDDSDYYGSDCHNDNATAGTVVGAIAGGIIGNQFGHGGGKVAATVGGVVLGGVAGNAIGKSIDCDDRPYAYPAYRRGFGGPVGDDYEWQHDDAHGYMRPTREYRWHGRTCRDFEEVSYRDGREYRHDGTACRDPHGDWRVR